MSNGKIDTTTNGKMVFELFPIEYIQLNQELNTMFHPKLSKILAQYGPDDLDVKLAQIAAYCKVGLDGDYRLADRMNLCKILLKRLVELRIDPDKPQIILG